MALLFFWQKIHIFFRNYKKTLAFDRLLVYNIEVKSLRDTVTEKGDFCYDFIYSGSRHGFPLWWLEAN